jgi:hypothetical protein
MGWLILDSVKASEYYQDEKCLRELFASELEFNSDTVSERILDLAICTYSDEPAEAAVGKEFEGAAGESKLVMSWSVILGAQHIDSVALLF